MYLLTGLKVGHSTHHRKVNQIELPLPDLKQGLSEISIDGGKIRLRTEEKGEPSFWQEYKTARLQGIYYGAFFQDNLSLTDWINSQTLTQPLYCYFTTSLCLFERSTGYLIPKKFTGTTNYRLVHRLSQLQVIHPS